jgi:anti-anti-sigma factor
MLGRWLPQNLYLRMLLAMAVSITIVLAGVTAISVSDSQARLKQDMLGRGLDYTKILIHAASVYVAQKDAHQLTLTATAATEGNQVQFVAFYDETGTLLAAAAAPDAPPSTRAPFGDLLRQAQASSDTVIRWSDDHLEIAQPIIYQGQDSGTVALRVAAEGLEANLNRELTRTIFTAVILAMVISLTVGLLLRQFVIVPLRQLSNASDQVSAGTWVSPTGQERRDEFGSVARSFSQMVATLQMREAQLQEQVVAVQTLNTELDARVIERTQELHQLVGHQEELLAQIRQMSTPVVPVLEGVIVLPIVGSLDTQRASQLIQSVLNGIEEQHAHLAVLDITGVPVVDSQVAKVILQASDAARLLGAAAVLVGIRPEVAQTLVQLGVNLEGIRTFATLQEALQATSRRMKNGIDRTTIGVRR